MIFSKKKKIKTKKNKKKKGGMKKKNNLSSEQSFTNNNESQENNGSAFLQKLSSKAQKKIIGSSLRVKGKEGNNNNKNPVVQGFPNLYLTKPPHTRRVVSLPLFSDSNNGRKSAFSNNGRKSAFSNSGRKSAFSNSGVVRYVRGYMNPKQGAKLRAATPNQSMFSNENSKYKNIPYKKLENHYLYPSFSECSNIRTIKEKYKCNELKFHENLTSFYDLFKKLNIKEDIPTIWKVIIGRYKPEYYSKASRFYKLELIPDLCFQNQKLSKIIKIPESVKIIGKKAFEGCDIEEVIFTHKLDLDLDCFRNNKIKKLDLSNALSININSFRDNYLEELILPHLDVKIHPFAFQSRHNNLKVIRNIRPSMIFKNGVIDPKWTPPIPSTGMLLDQKVAVFEDDIATMPEGPAKQAAQQQLVVDKAAAAAADREDGVPGYWIYREYDPDFSFGNINEWLEEGYYIKKEDGIGNWVKNLDFSDPEIKKSVDEGIDYFKIKT